MIVQMCENTGVTNNKQHNPIIKINDFIFFSSFFFLFFFFFFLFFFFFFFFFLFFFLSFLLSFLLSCFLYFRFSLFFFFLFHPIPQGNKTYSKLKNLRKFQ